jgi:two-component system response regulator HydG
MARILLIDDDKDILTLLERFLSKNGYEVKTAFKGVQGEKLVSEFNPDLVLSDYRLDDMDGAELLSKIKEIKPDLPVIIMTGYSDLRTAIRLVRAGAYDYMTKPLIPDEILHNVKQALTKRESNSSAPGEVNVKKSKAYKYLLSKSVHSRNLEHQISLIAPTNYSVIVYGESGAGKEGVARMIHEKSTRSDKPFVAMDSGAISRELAASELFGHEKGSFTGAVNQKIGHFEMAYGHFVSR